MSTYIDAGGRLHHDLEANLALTCPHCQVLSHVTPIAVPGFDELVAHRPKQVGVVYRCDSCNAPIFLRFPIKMFGNSRIELGGQFSEVERPREKFSYTYLPEEVDVLFRETLTCYSNASYNAFASMCRRTMQAAFADLGETGKLRVFDQLNDVRVMADLDAATFIDIKRVIFGSDNDPYPDLPTAGRSAGGHAGRDRQGSAVPGVRAQGPAAAGDDDAALLCRRVDSQSQAAQEHAVRLAARGATEPAPH